MAENHLHIDTFKVMAKGGGSPFFCNADQFEKNKDKWEKVDDQKAPIPAENSELILIEEKKQRGRPKAI